jgi:uncharacterized membrane protein YphA (DoxX/SURF4 family)
MNGINKPVVTGKFDTVLQLLKLTYGIAPILAGLDKLGFNKIVDWEAFLNPSLANSIPSSKIIFIIGILEIIAGVLVLTPKWTKYGAYLVLGLLGLFVLNLLSTGAHYDAAIREAMIGIGVLAYIWLLEVK